MSSGFVFSDKHVTDFHTLGFTVFRQILPPSLIRDLRKVSEKARELARAESGDQAQRLQPVSKYDLDQKPLQNYSELPVLCDAVKRLLTPRHHHGDLNFVGILLEPAKRPWRTDWHRDWRDHMPEEVFEEEFRADWDKQVFDVNHLNQINCPLYDDNCTWFVPGSHYRQQNTTGEIAAARAKNPQDGVPTDEEVERWNAQYCENMPGAVQLHLNAGDFAIYRPAGWHLGNYVPYCKRATLHDSAWTPEYYAYVKERAPRRDAAMKRWQERQMPTVAVPDGR